MTHYTAYKKLAFLFLVPQLVIIAVFCLWPACKALIQAFFFSDAFGVHKHFAGLLNFSDLIDDPEFLTALGVTLIVACAVTLMTMGAGLLLASLLVKRTKSRWLYKSLLTWPYAVAPAVAAILWRFLCQPNLGWFAYGLHYFNYDLNYHVYPKQALMLVILTASWQQMSYNFLFFLAALQAIPNSLIDAAILDGASAWRRFWQIIFPLLSPTSFFLLVMNLIYAFFDTFGIIDILTQGGPFNTTSTLIYKVYRDGFVNLDPGRSAAQSVLLMVLVTGLAYTQFRYLEKKVHYTDG